MSINFDKFLKPSTGTGAKTKINYGKFIQKRPAPTKQEVAPVEPPPLLPDFLPSGDLSSQKPAPSGDLIARMERAKQPTQIIPSRKRKDATGRTINVFPEHLGGGAYYDTMADRPPTTERGDYGGVETKEGFERDHITSLFLGGVDTIENIKLRQSGNMIERFLDTPVQSVKNRQEGKYAKERDIYNRYKENKISRPEAITELKRWEFEQEIDATKNQDLIKSIASNMFDMIKGGAGLFTDAIPEAINAEYKGIGIGRMIDALHAGTEVKDEDKFLERSTLQQLNSVEVVKELPAATFRSVKNVGIGVLGAVSDIVGAAEWAGLKQAAPVSAKMDEWIEEVAPVNPSFAEKIQQGVGSMATFYIPGVGAMKTTQLLTTFSPKIASFAGASVMGVFESAAEAGGVYKDSKASGDSPELSNDKADKTFLANIALNIITNKLGIFGDKTKNAVLKGLIASPLEALQEGTQQIISNVANGRPLLEGVRESSTIGGILGFFGGAGNTGRVTGGRRKEVVEEVKELEALIEKAVEVETLATPTPPPPGAPAAPKVDFAKVAQAEKVEAEATAKPTEVIEEDIEIFSVKEQVGEIKKKTTTKIKQATDQATIENLPMDRKSLKFEGVESKNFTDVVENFATQHIEKLKALYSTAEAKTNEVIQILEALPGEVKAIVDIKRPTSIVNKIIRKRDDGRADYGVEDIGDFVRSSVIYNEVTVAKKAVQDLQNKYPADRIKVQDFFEAPTDMGFTGINVDITLKDGSVSEMQFHSEESWQVKQAIHPFYEKARPFGQKIPAKLKKDSVTAAQEAKRDFGVAKKATDLTREQEGATISLGGRQPKKGFVFAPSKTTETKIPLEDFGFTDTAKFIKKNKSELEKPGNKLGTWVEDGNVYLDVVKVVNDEQQAVTQAEKADQEAIFDLEKFETKHIKNYEKENNTYRYKGQDTSTGAPGDSGKPTSKGKEKVVKVTARKEKIALKKPVKSKEGLKKESAAFKRVQERLKLETQDVPTFNQLNLAQDVSMALDFVEQQPVMAKKVALGLASPPPGITETAISIAREEKALADGDFGDAARMATARSLRQTRRGQEIVAERGRFDENSPETFVKLVLQARARLALKYEYSEREDKLTKKLQKSVSEKAKVQRKIIDKKAAKVQSAQDIINSLIC